MVSPHLLSKARNEITSTLQERLPAAIEIVSGFPIETFGND